MRKTWVVRIRQAPLWNHRAALRASNRSSEAYVHATQQRCAAIVRDVLGSASCWPPVAVGRPSDLKQKLQSQLNGPTATGSNHGIGSGYVRGGASAAEYSSGSRRWIVVGPAVLAAKGIGKIGMIKNVEKFRAELRAESFRKFPGLPDREIPVAKSRIAEFVASHRAKSP